jgi:hypothetical protein
MIAPAADNGPSLMLIEGSLTAIAFAVAFALPRLGSAWFTPIERAFSRLAARKRLSVLLVGVTALLARLAILPFCPIPLPFVQDDFSFLLAAKTFALGRLVNPMPAMWVHFESIQVTVQPTYVSMYFPAQGLILAAGKVLFGHPWFGLLIVNALMCAAFTWMLQAWLPPRWALLGGTIAILRIALFSYWINTYSGGGSIAALGAALLLGGLPRFIRHTRFRDALLMALGVSILALSRPYEGLLLCLLAAALIAHWLSFGERRPPVALVLRRTALPLAVVMAAVAWLGYYDYRAFGNPRTLPYTVDRAEYAAAPYSRQSPQSCASAGSAATADAPCNTSTASSVFAPDPAHPSAAKRNAESQPLKLVSGSHPPADTPASARPAPLHQLRSLPSGSRTPNPARRRRDRPIRLHRNLKSARMQRINQRSSSCSSGSPPVHTTNRFRAESPAATSRDQPPPPALRRLKLPPPTPSTPTKSVSQNLQIAVARSASRPDHKIASRKPAEHRRAPACAPSPCSV